MKSDFSMQGFRASILDFIDDPYVDEENSYRYFADGLLVVEDGLVKACGDYSELRKNLQGNIDITEYDGDLIMPGFIDTHVHYPQTDIIASHSSQLLDWLERYTFPVERDFSDIEIAANTAEFFISQLLANGTTSAMVFATIHPQSVDAIFAAASKFNMRLISGKVMMDRHAPDYLCDSAQDSYDDSLMLIRKWHNNKRFHYAVTPRFAPTSSEAQLKVAQQLVNEFMDVYLQSHVAENQGEVKWARDLFPWSRSYLDIYDHFGLLGDRSVYAHCIYLDDKDRERLAKSGTAVSFCPTSNLFLGSGLFDLEKSLDQGILLGMGSDVGGGTSFNMLKTLHEAYKVGQLTGYNTSPMQSFYMATLGAAKSLYLDDRIGNFEKDREADFIVVDKHATPLMERRLKRCDNLQDELFALMVLGDDRNIRATHVMGKCCYQRPQAA